jgi:hypothetical protein
MAEKIDKKLSAYDFLTNISADDLFVILESLGSENYANKKIKFSDLLTNLSASTEFTNALMNTLAKKDLSNATLSTAFQTLLTNILAKKDLSNATLSTTFQTLLTNLLLKKDLSNLPQGMTYIKYKVDSSVGTYIDYSNGSFDYTARYDIAGIGVPGLNVPANSSASVSVPWNVYFNPDRLPSSISTIMVVEYASNQSSANTGGVHILFNTYTDETGMLNFVLVNPSSTSRTVKGMVIRITGVLE